MRALSTVLQTPQVWFDFLAIAQKLFAVSYIKKKKKRGGGVNHSKEIEKIFFVVPTGV